MIGVAICRRFRSQERTVTAPSTSDGKVGISSIGVYRVVMGLVLAAPTTVAIAQHSRGSSPDWAAFDKYVAQSARDWRVPGMAIAVVRGDSLVFGKGYGLRKVGAGDQVDAHTRFAIGSTTKAMTAAALAMLADDGKPRLDGRG